MSRLRAWLRSNAPTIREFDTACYHLLQGAFHV